MSSSYLLRAKRQCSATVPRQVAMSSTLTASWRGTVSFDSGMDHAIRIVAFSVGFSLRTIRAPLLAWMQEMLEKRAALGDFRPSTAGRRSITGRPSTARSAPQVVLSRQDCAPVHVKDFTGNEIRILSTQKQHRPGNFLVFADAAERNRAQDLLAAFRIFDGIRAHIG